jgi:hypothetical protein
MARRENVPTLFLQQTAVPGRLVSQAVEQTPLLVRTHIAVARGTREGVETWQVDAKTFVVQRNREQRWK